MIERLGFGVDIAGDGAEAVRLIQRADVEFGGYAAIWIDLQMPYLDGLEATRVICEEVHSRIPIFALSASVLPEDRARCEAAGMNGHLAKPIDRIALADALDRAVRAPAW